ncbi:hypothetical protein PCANB_000197 [Pneumocystis canis]|nr:hypothetical protein PCK1_000060 [Pneumocystis canis]KAG5439915.1 hypothetical protein PCANB_000197 [Pneumocystis canis]
MKSEEKKNQHKNIFAQRNTAGGIREKSKKQRISSKVFLNNPYNIQWPQICKEDQEIILKQILDLFLTFSNQTKKNKILKEKNNKKNIKESADIFNEEKHIERCENDNFFQNKMDEKTSITKYMTLGINETTRLLEIYSKMCIPSSAPSYLKVLEKKDQEYLSMLKNNKLTNILKVIFVCREDIHSSILYSHIPILCSIVNEAISKIEMSNNESQSGIRLITLPKGSEQKLSKAAGLKRLAVMGIMKNTPHAEEMIDYIFKKIPSPHIPWLDQRTIFHPTSITQIIHKQ